MNRKILLLVFLMTLFITIMIGYCIVLENNNHKIVIVNCSAPKDVADKSNNITVIQSEEEALVYD